SDLDRITSMKRACGVSCARWLHQSRPKGNVPPGERLPSAAALRLRVLGLRPARDLPEVRHHAPEQRGDVLGVFGEQYPKGGAVRDPLAAFEMRVHHR